MEHNINSMGDFESCKNKGCCWSATWSMGMMCDHCRLHKCQCPCPLSKQWIRDNSEKIRLQRIKDIVEMDIGTYNFMINEFSKDCFVREDKHLYQCVLQVVERYKEILDEKIPKYD